MIGKRKKRVKQFQKIKHIRNMDTKKQIDKPNIYIHIKL